MVRISITLKDGTVYAETFKRLPRHWMSRAMALAPYGTDYRGCSFKREKVA